MLNLEKFQEELIALGLPVIGVSSAGGDDTAYNHFFSGGERVDFSEPHTPTMIATAEGAYTAHDPEGLTEAEQGQEAVLSFLSTYEGLSIEDNYPVAGATMMRALFQYLNLADKNGNVKTP